MRTLTAKEFTREVRKINPEFPFQHWAILVEVAHHPGITMPELMSNFQLTAASISRGIRALSTYRTSSGDIQGLGLLEKRQDIYEPGRFAVSLTPKGKAMMDKLLGYFTT